MGSWKPTTSYATGRYGHAMVANNGFLYMFGGCSAGACTTFQNDVQYAALNADGTVGTWNYTHNSTNDGGTFSAGFTTGRAFFTVTVYNGYVYLAGGCSAGACTTFQNDVQYAVLNSNGTIGTWSTTASFNTPRFSHTAIAYGGYLYVIGGCSAGASGCTNYLSDVQYAKINSNGTVNAWSSTTNFNIARYAHSSVAYNGYLYVIGGCSAGTAVCTSVQSDVQFAAFNANGTLADWDITTSLTSGLYGQSSFINNGYLYVAGGYDGTTLYTDAQYALLCNNNFNYGASGCNGLAQGAVGAWTSTIGIHYARYYNAAVAYNGFVYNSGGYDGTILYSDVQYAPVNANGTFLVDTYGTNNNFVSTTAVTTARYQLSSVAYNGFLYNLGGADNAPTVYNIVQYAPLNADGTVGSWTATTGFTTARAYFKSVVYNGYLYILGGCSTTILCSTPQSDVQYALICTGKNSGVGGCSTTVGTVGTWTATTSFTTARWSFSSVVYNGYMYVMGGKSASSTYLNDVQYALICTAYNSGSGGCSGTAGTVGTWATTNTLLTTRSEAAATVYNGYIYSSGGCNTAVGCTSVNNTFDYALICTGANSGTGGCGATVGTVGTWASTTNFTTARWGHSIVANNGYMFVLGQNNGTLGTTDVKYAFICDGSSNGGCTSGSGNIGKLGTWTTSKNLLITARQNFGTAVYNGRVYVIAGLSNTQTALVEYASLNAMPNSAHYEQTIDTGLSNTSLTDFIINGQSVCQYTVTYSTARTTALGQGRFPYAAYSTVKVTPGTTISLGSKKGRYLNVSVSLDDQACGTPSTITDITLDYNYVAPDAPSQLSSEGPTNGTFSAVSSFTSAREYQAATAYNGYLYILGGFDGTTYYNDIQYAAINSDGTLGSFTTSPITFNFGRYGLTALAYNGYLYLSGGRISGTSTNCKDSGSGSFCNDIQYAAFNSDGSIGSFTTNTNYFSFPRESHATIAYNGYLYVTGGDLETSSTNCKNSGTGFLCNDIQYAAFNSDGSIGSFTTNTNYFSFPRNSFQAVAYNRFFYILGGNEGVSDTNCKNTGTSTKCNDIQYATINTSTGAIGTFTTNTNYFTTPRSLHSSYVYNGYLYIIAGQSTGGGTQNDVQHALIGSSGSVGTFTTSGNTFSNARYGQSSVVYKGHIYVAAGYDGSIYNDVQMAALNTALQPTFHAAAAQQNGSYLRYRIELCADSTCSSVVRNIDQTSSQTGWNNQDQQTTTAYTGAATYPEASTPSEHAYAAPALKPGTTYYWQAYAIDPAYSNTWSSASSIFSFTTVYTASVPALLSPADGATNVSTLPLFQLAASDPQGDYLRYKIDVCSTSNCSSVVRTIDQNSSQTGWQGQGTQSGTAYIGNVLLGLSAVASHQYQTTALSTGTQYWWRGYSIDPGGANTFSSASAISTFTTTSNPSGQANNVQLRGGTQFKGGTKLGN